MSLAEFHQSSFGLGEPDGLKFPTLGTHQKITQVFEPVRRVESPTQGGWHCPFTGVPQDSGKIFLSINLLREEAALLALNGQVFDPGTLLV